MQAVGLSRRILEVLEDNNELRLTYIYKTRIGKNLQNIRKGRPSNHLDILSLSNDL